MKETKKFGILEIKMVTDCKIVKMKKRFFFDSGQLLLIHQGVM